MSNIQTNSPDPRFYPNSTAHAVETAFERMMERLAEVRRKILINREDYLYGEMAMADIAEVVGEELAAMLSAYGADAEPLSTRPLTRETVNDALYERSAKSRRNKFSPHRKEYN